MPRLAVLHVVLAAILAMVLPTPVLAQSVQTWISGNGNNTNASHDCPRDAPCKTIASAISRTLPGGTVSCADPVYSLHSLTVTITQSVNIDCTGIGAQFFTLDQAGFSIATPGVSVTFRGLAIFALPSYTTTSGIDIIAAEHVHVEDCRIYGIGGAAGTGINFRPYNAGARLTVNDTSFSRSGKGSAGGAIVVKPQANGSARVSISGVTVTNNVFGIAADGTGSRAGINMTIADSMISGNSQDGVVATTPDGGAPIGVLLTNTKTINNNIGVRSLGPNVTVRLDNSKAVGNGIGLAYGSGGALLSAGNNIIQANGTNGVFSGPIPLN